MQVQPTPAKVDLPQTALRVHAGWWHNVAVCGILSDAGSPAAIAKRRSKRAAMALATVDDDDDVDGADLDGESGEVGAAMTSPPPAAAAAAVEYDQCVCCCCCCCCCVALCVRACRGEINNCDCRWFQAPVSLSSPVSPVTSAVQLTVKPPPVHDPVELVPLWRDLVLNQSWERVYVTERSTCCVMLSVVHTVGLSLVFFIRLR